MSTVSDAERCGLQNHQTVYILHGTLHHNKLSNDVKFRAYSKPPLSGKLVHPGSLVPLGPTGPGLPPPRTPAATSTAGSFQPIAYNHGSRLKKVIYGLPNPCPTNGKRSAH